MVWREEKNRDLGPLLIILLFLVLLFGGIKVKQYLDTGLPIWSILTNTKLDTKESLTDGTVVSGFPDYLLQVVEDSKITLSRRAILTENGNKFELLTTTMLTSATPANIYGAYSTLLQEKGYSVQASPGAGGGLLAIGKTNSVIVSISTVDLNTREIRVDVKNPISDSTPS